MIEEAIYRTAKQFFEVYGPADVISKEEILQEFSHHLRTVAAEEQEVLDMF